MQARTVNISVLVDVVSGVTVVVMSLVTVVVVILQCVS
jgi:hypothetical protein